jgi:hypothetical protein
LEIDEVIKNLKQDLNENVYKRILNLAKYYFENNELELCRYFIDWLMENDFYSENEKLIHDFQELYRKPSI